MYCEAQSYIGNHNGNYSIILSLTESDSVSHDTITWIVMEITLYNKYKL